MKREIPLWTEGLDSEQRGQLDRALKHFHEAQQAFTLVDKGPAKLPLAKETVDVHKYFASPTPTSPQVAVTGRRLDDDWFCHAQQGSALMSLADWEVAFAAQADRLSADAPDANILTSIALVTLLVLGNRDDVDVMHEETSGCLFDLCANKPDRVIKMRSGFVCGSCCTSLAMGGVSTVELDAIHAVLERVRSLVLGRRPQIGLPRPGNDDDAFVKAAELPARFALPQRLLDACRQKSISVVVGSGLSIQSDVAVQYDDQLGWNRLPSWTEVLARLAESARRYRDNRHAPRATASLDEFLAELDYFRAALGEHAYYRRALLDIFTPHVLDAGRANRLLFRLPLKWLLTTNYDPILQYAGPPGTHVYTWKEAVSAREFQVGPRARAPLVKIHGCGSRPDTVVLTRLEYEELTRDGAYREMMQSIFQHQTVLFLGYGMNDPRDLDLMLRQAQLAGAAEGEKFALLPAAKCAEAQAQFKTINFIPYENHSDVPSVLAVLARTAA